MKISACIPTRGDVPMGRIVDHLVSYPEIDEVIIVKGATPFNRYLAAGRAKNDLIFIQDDDCLTDLRPVIDQFAKLPWASKFLVNAMTSRHAAQYPGSQTLIGFGAIFGKHLLECFEGWERDALFLRESDRVFATVNPHCTVFPSIELLPHATAENRLYRQPDHVACRLAIEARIFEKTGIRA